MMLRRTWLTAAMIGLTWTSTATRAAETFQVDPVHSAVVYRVKHLNVSYSIGRFNEVTGEFRLDADDPSACRFAITIPVESLDTGNPMRDGHLKGPDFFNAKQFPTITFQSDSVAPAGPDAFEVKGRLTLHGATRPITLKVEKTGAGKGMRGESLAGLYTEFTIRRSEFDMGNMPDLIGDEVRLTVSLEGGHK